MNKLSTYGRRMYLCVWLIMGSLSLKGQTFAEWFSQKKTQTKYLVQQIALIKLYGGYIKTGYTVAKGGLDFINAARDGELNLFQTFFGSLASISPAIAHYKKVADIMQMQVLLLKRSGNLLQTLRSGQVLNAHDLERVAGQLMVVEDKAEGTFLELLDVITAKNLKMTDDERIRKIDRLYEDMTEHTNFLEEFAGQLYLMAYEKQKEQVGGKRLQVWYGLEDQ